MSQSKGIPFTPFRVLDPTVKPYGARFSTRTHVRELPLTVGQTEQMFEFSGPEMQQLDSPSLFYTAYDEHGPIEIERIAVLGLRHNIIFKRQAGPFAKLRGQWQNVDVYYD